MDTIALPEFCRHHGHSRPVVNEKIKQLGIKVVKKGRTNHITLENATRLLSELELPEELVPEIVRGTVLSVCRNPMWVLATFDDREGKHPVLIPRRLMGRFTKGKWIQAERIRDKDGETYRHESLARIRG